MGPIGNGCSNSVDTRVNVGIKVIEAGLGSMQEKEEGNDGVGGKAVICKPTRRLFMQRTNGQLDVPATLNPQATTPYR